MKFALGFLIIFQIFYFHWVNASIVLYEKRSSTLFDHGRSSSSGSRRSNSGNIMRKGHDDDSEGTGELVGGSVDRFGRQVVLGPDQLNRTNLEPKTLCGRNLRHYITFICKNKFFTPNARSVGTPNTRYANSYTRPKRFGEDPLDGISLDGIPAEEVPRTIVQECCKNPCSKAQLIKYCPRSMSSSSESSSDVVNASSKGDDGIFPSTPFLLQLGFGDGYGAKFPNNNGINLINNNLQPPITFVKYKPVPSILRSTPFYPITYSRPVSKNGKSPREIISYPIRFQPMNSEETERDHIDEVEALLKAQQRPVQVPYGDHQIQVKQDNKPQRTQQGSSMERGQLVIFPFGTSDGSYVHIP